MTSIRLWRTARLARAALSGAPEDLLLMALAAAWQNRARCVRVGTQVHLVRVADDGAAWPTPAQWQALLSALTGRAEHADDPAVHARSLAVVGLLAHPSVQTVSIASGGRQLDLAPDQVWEQPRTFALLQENPWDLTRPAEIGADAGDDCAFVIEAAVDPAIAMSWSRTLAPLSRAWRRLGMQVVHNGRPLTDMGEEPPLALQTTLMPGVTLQVRHPAPDDAAPLAWIDRAAVIVDGYPLPLPLPDPQHFGRLSVVLQVDDAATLATMLTIDVPWHQGVRRDDRWRDLLAQIDAAIVAGIDQSAPSPDLFQALPPRLQWASRWALIAPLVSGVETECEAHPDLTRQRLAPKDNLPLILHAPGLWVQAPFDLKDETVDPAALQDPESWGVEPAEGGIASFLPLIEAHVGPPHALIAGFPPDAAPSWAHTLIWRRAAPDDPGMWSVDDGAHWFPVTEPVVAVYARSAYDPRDTVSEWGIPAGATVDQAVQRWGWLLYAPPPDDESDAWDVDEAPPRIFGRQLAWWRPKMRLPNGIAARASVRALLDRLEAATDDPIVRLRIERSGPAVVALIAVRASGAEERWPVTD